MIASDGLVGAMEINRLGKTWLDAKHNNLTKLNIIQIVQT